MRWFFLLVSFFLTQALQAAVDVEGKTPYQLKVVLRFSDHPHFTPHFRAELKRELQGSLQAALGTLGNVEIIDLNQIPMDKWEPLWKQVEEKGLTSLDGLNEITGFKTHFLRIEQMDGAYRLQARQHDGTTGFVSPLIRKERSNDRGFIIRQAGMMIGQDFGLVGTIDNPGRQNGTIKFKGGALGTPVTRWVKKGDVFAIMQIRRAPKSAKTPTVGTRIPEALLQVIDDPKEGQCTCQVFSRFEEGFRQAGAIEGYRCIKLGTVATNVRIQLVDEKGQPHRNSALQIRLQADKFPDQPNEGEEMLVQNGVFESKKLYSQMVCARISIADRTLAKMPIELLDNQVVYRQIKIDPAAEVRARMNQSRDDTMSLIRDARLIQNRLFQDLGLLVKAGKNKDALTRAENAHSSLEKEVVNLKDELDRLQKRAKDEMPGLVDFTTDCQRQYQVLKDKQKELADYMEKLKEAIKIENDPNVQNKRKQIQTLIDSADLAIQQADIEEALMSMEQALAQLEDPEGKKKLQERYDTLKRTWTIQDNDHARVRKFVYETWAKLSSAEDVKTALPKAQEAFQKCKAVRDRYTLNKLLLTAPEVVNKLVEHIKTLSDSSDADAQTQLADWKKVSEELEKFIGEVTEFLKGG